MSLCFRAARPSSPLEPYICRQPDLTDVPLFQSREAKFSVEPYICRQPDLTSQMRAVLVDWLVEVAEEYKLHDETLYLAINYIDR